MYFIFFYCNRSSKIFNLLNSEDVINTVKCNKKIGVEIIKKKKYLEILVLALMGLKQKKTNF